MEAVVDKGSRWNKMKCSWMVTGFLFMTCSVVAAASWQPTGELPAGGSGLPLSGPGVIVVDPVNSQLVYAGAKDVGIIKSVDGGASWLTSNLGLTPTEYYNAVSVESLAIESVNHQTLYAGTVSRGIYKSTDGAASWVQVSSGLPTDIDTGLTNCSVAAIVIDPVDRQTLYAGVQPGGVFKSIDAGGTWSVASSGLPEGAAVSVLAIDPADPQVLYAGASQFGVFRSSDGGQSWVFAGAGLPDGSAVHSLVMNGSDSQTVYAATDRGVFKTSDSGGYWNATDSGLLPDSYTLVVDPTNPQILFAAGKLSNGISRTIDGGATWSSLNDGLPFHAIAALAINPADGQTLYASSNSQNVVYTRLDDGLPLTLAVAGSGSIHTTPGVDTACAGACIRDYPPESVVNITAQPGAGYLFSGWSGACSGTGACQVAMTEARYVGATFSVAPVCANIMYLNVPANNAIGSYNISWSASSTPGVTYVLTENDNPIYIGPALSYAVSGRGNGCYTYTVRATKPGYLDSAVKGPATTCVTLTCGNISYLNAPSVSATGNYNINWSTSSTPGVTYVLRENGTRIYSGSARSYAVSGRGNGSYTYTVKAIKTGYLDSAVKGKPTTSVVLTCSSPASFAVPANDTTGSYTIKWTASVTPGVTYVLTENGIPIYSGPALSYVVSGRGNGTYSYAIKATRAGYCDSAEKTLSTIIVLTCADINLTATTAVNSISGNYGLNWTASSTAGVTYTLTENGVILYAGPNLGFYAQYRSNGSYVYTVKAAKPGYVDSAVKSITISVLLSCDKPPTITAPASSATGSYTVSWSPNTTSCDTHILYENGVEIYRGSYFNFAVTNRPSGTYSYTVKAVRLGYVDSPLTGPVTVVVTR